MTVLGSILPSEPSARIVAAQRVLRQLSEPLGPREYGGIQMVGPISSLWGSRWWHLVLSSPQITS